MNGGDIPPSSPSGRKGGENGSGRGAGASALLLLFTDLLGGYSAALEKNPILVKVLSSGFLGGLGDIICQKVSGTKIDDIDYRRILVFVTVCALYIAPVIHYWFNWLGSIPMPAGASETAKALYMMVLDQIIGATAVTFGFFYAFELADSLVPLKGRTVPASPLGILRNGTQAVRESMWKTLVANYYCWPAINFLNFRFVPLAYRVLVSNLAATLWNCYLSGVANKD
jgi:hypothetical protein